MQQNKTAKHVCSYLTQRPNCRPCASEAMPLDQFFRHTDLRQDAQDASLALKRIRQTEHARAASLVSRTKGSWAGRTLLTKSTKFPKNCNEIF